MKKSIKAEIIADSINPHGQRVTSFILTFPRFILAELNTHRAFSRNSASSRAIPFEKMVAMVQEDPFIPIKWMKDHKGMQGNEYFTEDEVLEYDLIGRHLLARDRAVACARKQAYLTYSLDGWIGVTKQIVNRYLEPFMWHTAIVTATDFENFFALRAHKATEIHFQDLAYKMLNAYNESTPNKLLWGQWHIPFGDNIDEKRVYQTFTDEFGKNDLQMAKVRISTARCARVSYMNYEGKDDYIADEKLYNSLSEMGYWSPFEHCCQAINYNSKFGNFKGFVQHRFSFGGENKIDDRVIRKSFENE